MTKQTHTPGQWTAAKEKAFRRLDRKVMNGKASRAEVMRALDLKRERPAARFEQDLSKAQDAEAS